MTTPQELLDKCPELTTLPMVYHKLNNAINSPSCTTGIVSRIISHDPILTVKVLKMVNSAFYGFPHEIEDIPQALLIIGMQQLNDLVLTNSIIKLFEEQQSQVFSLEDFWKYSLGSGLTARILASTAKDKYSERIFVAGLLHGVGKLIMAISAPELSLKAYEYSIKNNISSRDAEKEVFGFDHQEMNAYVMNSWALPHSITDITSHYMTPEASTEHKKESYLIGLTRTICQSMRIGSCGDFFIPPVPDNCLSIVGLSPSDIEETTIQLKNQYKDIIKTFLH